MYVGYVVCAVLLSVSLTMSARLKLIREPRAVEMLGRAGVPLAWFPGLATLELAAVVGLLAGLAYAPLGLAAAAGVVAYFVVAVGFHVRAHDTYLVAPAFLGVLGAAAFVVRLAA
jgi:hypothetical protein